MIADDAIQQVAAEAIGRLYQRHLLDDDAMLSIRLPGTRSLAVCNWVAAPPRAGGVQGESPQAASQPADFSRLKVVPLDGSTDVPKDNAQDDTRVHPEIYRVRPDVGAILTSRLRWSSTLARWREPVPAVFDEQVRQLGRSVELLGTAGSGLLPADCRQLRAGANAFLLGDGALCLGTNLQRLVLNTELLEKCAQAYLLARLTGRTVRRIPWIVRFIANRRLQRDQQRAADAYARGETPVGLTAY